MLQKPLQNEYDSWFAGYISLVPEGNLFDNLARQREETVELFSRVPKETGEYRYAPEKWSVKEVLGHVVDAERVFSFRAMTFARNDQNSLPGFDEQEYVKNANFGAVSLQRLLKQYEHLRNANILMLQDIPEKAWLNQGISNGAPITVRALGYIIAGHELHHRKVLISRYEPFKVL